MGWLEAFQNDHTEVHNKGNLTHDALAGAVAYEAARSYEKHLAENGQPDNHAMAKEVMAGLAAAALTRIVETKGLDAWDEHKKKQLQRQAEERLNETILVEQYR